MTKQASSIIDAESLARTLAPALVSAVAVLIQIRDGKDRDIDSAIKEARAVIGLVKRSSSGSEV
jgi:hypothetical protein